MFYECKCGARFPNRQRLTKHVALQNPHWPRSHPDDAHGWTNDPRLLLDTPHIDEAVR